VTALRFYFAHTRDEVELTQIRRTSLCRAYKLIRYAFVLFRELEWFGDVECKHARAAGVQVTS
jgi:hypothetical protein